MNRRKSAVIARTKLSCMFTMNPKRQRSESTDSIRNSSSDVSSRLGSKSNVIIKKKVDFFPMVAVQEFEKYTDTEKQDIFLSQNELQQFKEREMMLIACKTKQSIYRRLLSFTPLLNNDLGCTTIMTIDEIKMRKKIRQAAVATVLKEQKFKRDYSIIEAVHWEGGRNIFSAVAEQQALRRGIQAERER